MPEPAAAPRTRFHHGDLHAQALAAARELVARSGVDELVLREVASTAGVNHRALYRHFPDKRALILQLAAQELDTLVRAMDVALASSHAGDGPRVMMEVYVGYALEQPHLYEMVFSLPLRDDVDQETEVGQEVRKLIRLAARVFARGGDTATITRDRVVRAWGAAHGLALLMRRGALRAGERRATERYIVDAALLAAGPPG